MSTFNMIEKKERKTVEKESPGTEIHQQRDEPEQSFLNTYEALRKHASQHYSCDG